MIRVPGPAQTSHSWLFNEFEASWARERERLKGGREGKKKTQKGRPSDSHQEEVAEQKGSGLCGVNVNTTPPRI